MWGSWMFYVSCRFVKFFSGFLFVIVTLLQVSSVFGVLRVCRASVFFS